MSEQLSTALVTGGSRGIGKAIAETLAKAGYQVYLTYVSKADEAEAVARNIVAAGGKACAFRLDVADAEAVAAFFNDRGYDVRVHRLGIGDEWVEHGTPGQLYALCGYDEEGILRALLDTRA